jgi:hypothetical protein
VSSSWTIFTTCWPGVRLFAEGAHADGGDELLDDAEVDVGLEQGEPDLAHRARDRLVVEHAAPAQVAERGRELVRERVEHRRLSVRGGFLAADGRDGERARSARTLTRQKRQRGAG